MPDLGGIRPIAHDPDERPTREDRAYGGSIFDIPVPLPRFLRSSGRLRRWAERRRERQRAGNVGSGGPGPFGG